MSYWRILTLCNLGAERSFEQQMRRLPGLIGWWPQTEESGTVADNAEGTAARDASYYSELTLQGASFPNGDLVALYADLGRLRFGTASLASAFNWNKFWLILWVLPDATEQADSSNHYWSFMVGAAGKTWLALHKSSLGPYYSAIDHRPNDGVGNRVALTDWVYSPNYTMFVVQVNQAGDGGHVWRNGVLIKTVAIIDESTDPNLDVSNVDYNVLTRGYAAAGAVPHFALGANALLTTKHVNDLYESIYPAVLDLFVCGDSKATDNDYWISKLLGNLEYSSGSEIWRERPYRVGLSGQKLADLHTYLDANLAAMTGYPTFSLINVGANDLSGGTAEAAFKADLRGCIDALLVRWGAASVYVTQPWRRGYNTEAAAMKTWILAVVGEYSKAYAGPDETTWLENGDDGTTYTDDGVHYNNAGHIEAANQWQTVLGY